MALSEDMRRSYLARQIGTLALSPVEPLNSMAWVRAASWHNTMVRLGLGLPLFLLHDLGLVLSGQGRVEIGRAEQRGFTAGLKEQAEAYAGLLTQVADSELAAGVTAWRIRDDLMAVLLSKLLMEPAQRWSMRRQWVGVKELPLDPGVYLNVDPMTHYGDFDAAPIHGLLAMIVEQQLYLTTAVEHIDLDTLRLLGMFGDSNGMGGAVDVADLLSVFSSPEANGVVNFSMDLLPSVLETKRTSGVQTFSVDGYASIERRGSVDSIVLSEFAYDEDIFIQKAIDNELYYYGHEKQRLEERSLHYVLMDSSASMRGDREVFGRGLALTLCKKLSLEGHEVWLRFFDSRLYEILHVSKNSEAALPHLLCFRSERGRNYGRVFRQLVGELSRIGKKKGRTVVLYLVTHGQCHIGVELVQQLVQLAQVYGVFILPSSNLHLDYLELLHRHQIVDEEALSSRERSVDRALEIVDDATFDTSDPAAEVG